MSQNAVKSPFKFLDAYTREDREFFFGRKAEVEELYDRVFESNLIVLYGDSGTGKTSLVNCGLAAEFNPADWLPVYLRRNKNLLQSLDTALREKARTPWAEDAPLYKKTRSLYLDYYQPLYLIFDQFEELFINGDQEEATRFFEAVRQLLHADKNTKILIIIRGDYLDKLSKYEFVIPSLFDNRMHLEKMSPRHLAEVIKMSCRHFGIDILDETEVLPQIIGNITDPKTGVELAYLQIYLDKLYRNDLAQAETHHRRVQFDTNLLDQTLRLDDVLSDFLKEQLELIEAELSQIGFSQKGVPLEVLFTLVTDQGTKTALDDDQIKNKLFRRKKITPEIIDYCITRFKELRIIRFLDHV